MVNLTLKHNVVWQAPFPLWAQNSSSGVRVIQPGLASYPGILRFDSDQFMPQMIDMVQRSPQRIGEWLVQHETWREPMPTPTATTRAVEQDGLSYLLDSVHQKSRRLKNTKPSLRLPRQKSMVAALQLDHSDIPVKLFQSSQQRFYLVSASLIVNDSGLPDQQLNLAQQEKASFVLRRLIPPPGVELPTDGETITEMESWDEYACIDSAAGERWQRIDRYASLASARLQADEMKLPMFPVGYHDDCGHGRVLLNGLIPVSRREKWLAATISNEVGSVVGESADAAISRAQMLFQNDVSEPWKALLEQADVIRQSLGRSIDSLSNASGKQDENNRSLRTRRDMIQMASWYVLLDCAKFLRQQIPALWNVISQLAANKALTVADFDLPQNEAELAESLAQAQLNNELINALIKIPDTRYAADTSHRLKIDVRRKNALLQGRIKRRLIDALVTIIDWEASLEQVESAFVRYDEAAVDDSNNQPPKALGIDPLWPDFLFPLSDPQFDGPLPGNATDMTLELQTGLIDELVNLIGKIIPVEDDPRPVSPPGAGLSQRDGWFIIRCVYERPRCGPLFPPLLSAPTQVFTMASFFDPDAPTRPVRIPMPLDISPAGLRKYQKNTAFIISDMLCGKIKKIRNMSFGDLVLSVLPWPFHKDLPDPGDSGPCKTSGGLNIGMVCSLSIPIVTLCALILLMIMVALFDLFFRWLPFLFLCLPIPGLKGKRST